VDLLQVGLVDLRLRYTACSGHSSDEQDLESGEVLQNSGRIITSL
jgi:hypothetical protein